MLDLLFSLSFMSLFLVPFMASYSTNLNFLFFWITWSTLVLSHSRLRVELFGSAAVRILCFVIPSLLGFLFDVLFPSAAVGIKALGEMGLPGGKRRRNVRWDEFKVAGWALFNVALSILMQAIIEMFFVRVLGRRSALKVSTLLPMPGTIIKHLSIGFIGRGILGYILHRYALHHPRSSFLAGLHKSWYHSLKSPYPLTAYYDHPLCFLVAKFFPMYLPAIIFRFHVLTYFIYLIIVTLEETFAYSGYTVLPIPFLVGGIARRTEMHMITQGDGNFGPWGLLDWLFGTIIETDEDNSREEEEREIQRKVSNALERSKRNVREGTLRRNTHSRR